MLSEFLLNDQVSERRKTASDISVLLPGTATRVYHVHDADRRRGMTVHRLCAADTVEEDEEDS